MKNKGLMEIYGNNNVDIHFLAKSVIGNEYPEN